MANKIGSFGSSLKKLEQGAEQAAKGAAKNLVKSAEKGAGEVKQATGALGRDVKQVAQEMARAGKQAERVARDGFEGVARNLATLPQTVRDLEHPYGDPKLLPPHDLGLHTTDAQLSTLLDQHTGSRLTQNNRVAVYVDGENALPRILSTLDSAKKSICYETYEFDKDGTTVDQVVDHLIAAKKRGVDVRVTADAIGGRELLGKNPELQRLRDAGIPVQTYNPVDSLGDLDVHRDHRKSVVVDGQTAIVGGMNTGDRYLGGPQVKGRFHDVNTIIQGPAVADVARDFLDVWKSESGQVIDPATLVGPKAAPIDTPNTQVKLRVIQHTPGKDANIRAAYLALINHATTNINIENGYPMSDDIIAALSAAAQRGVKVRYVYGSDMGALGMDARTKFDKLLAAGVQISIYPTPIHTKSLSVDGQYATVGSSNVDNVALTRNREIITLAEDPAYTRSWDQQLFEKDFVGSPDGKKSLKLEAPLHDPLWTRLTDAVLAKAWPDSYE